MKRLVAVLTVLFLCVSGGQALADSACARVSIEIAQDVTLERVAFDAKLVIHNNLPDKDLTNIRVDVTIEDSAGNLKNDLFFTKVSSLDNIDGVDGSGTVARNTTAEAHWLIIPSPGAGGETSAGVVYSVGATMTYTLDGEQTILPISPDRITVKPAPQLYLDYFMPYAVLGDNPFTPQVEPPVPYPLALRVINDGYGPANQLKIDSAQPKIVDNKQGLLIDFKLLGAAVNDSAVSPSLTVDMGDVPSKGAATAYWQMISTLSGHFVSFDATFSHSSELGGELTSLIKETHAYYLIHRIKVNLPGRDDRLDFLADTDKDTEHLPDTIFESEIPPGGTDRHDAQSPVTVVGQSAAPARPTTESPKVDVTLDLAANPTGWIYTKMADPSQGLLKLLDVVRADGVHLDPHNFWVDEGLDKDYKKTYTLQFVDYRANGSTPGTYTLVFTQPAKDVTPPTTSLVFDGPAVKGETTYLTPATRVVLTAVDNEGGSGVAGMFKKVGSDTAFLPAVPFNLAAGNYNLDYYSVDNAGNVEATKSAALVVDDAPPQIASFQAVPATFSPQAPTGVAASRTVDFVLSASDTVPTLPVTVAVSDAAGKVVRTLTGTAQSGTELHLAWDGLDNDGKPVPAGTYTATVKASDGLDSDSASHTATAQATVTAAEWFAATPVDPAPGADQTHPAISGTVAVWQDNRNGNWDIYLKDLSGSASSTRLTAEASNQERPAIDGNRVVWQDDRNGDWDIYAYDRSTHTESVVYSGAGDQTDPVVSGDWVAWQDNRSGNWDIWAKNLATGELRQITDHERDQIRPALSGTLLAWEDYRNGLGEIYTNDLAAAAETRITYNIADQILPAVDGNTLVWTDQRDGHQEIYRQGPDGPLRLTYGSGDRSQATVLGNLLVYTDYSAGANDPNLAYLDLQSGNGALLTSNPARQEESALGTGVVVWQDNRDGTWQIYRGALTVTEPPVEVQLRPGFNLVAVGKQLVDTYGTAAGLLASAPAELGLEKALGYSAPHGQFFEADSTSGGDFALTKGAGLALYARTGGTLKVAASGESTSYTLLAGVNHIGMLSVPYGYRAFDLLRSVGLEHVVSVRRFDNQSGLWQSAAVRSGTTGLETVGNDFVVHPGDGLVITMKDRVDGWTP